MISVLVPVVLLLHSYTLSQKLKYDEGGVGAGGGGGAGVEYQK